MARSYEAFKDHAGEYVSRNQGASFDRTPLGDDLEVTQTRASQITAPIQGLGRGAAGRLPAIRSRSIVQMGRSLRPAELFVTDPRTVRSIDPTPSMLRMGAITRDDAGQEAEERFEMTARQRRQQGTEVIDMTASHLKRRDIKNLGPDIREMRREGTSLSGIGRLGQFTAPSTSPEGRQAALIIMSSLPESAQVDLIRTMEWTRNILLKAHQYALSIKIIIDEARKLPAEQAAKILTPELAETEIFASDLAASLRESLTADLDVTAQDVKTKEFVSGKITPWGLRTAAIAVLNNNGVDLYIEQIDGFNEEGIPKIHTAHLVSGITPRRVVLVNDGAGTGLVEDLEAFEAAGTSIDGLLQAVSEYSDAASRGETIEKVDALLNAVEVLLDPEEAAREYERAGRTMPVMEMGGEGKALVTLAKRGWGWISKFLKSPAVKKVGSGFVGFLKSGAGKMSSPSFSKKTSTFIKTSRKFATTGAAVYAAVILAPAVGSLLRNGAKAARTLGGTASDLARLIRDAAPWIGGAAVVGAMVWIGTSVFA